MINKQKGIAHCLCLATKKGGSMMVHNTNNPMKSFVFLFVVMMTLGIVLVSVSEAITVNVTGVQKDGTLVTVSEYRWLIEEDATYHVNPGLPDPNTLAVSFHKSYMPVVNEGTEADVLPVLDPLKHYYLSILPDSGFTIGGAQIAPGQQDVTVYVNALPLPTAQVTVFVFEDIQPINNAPDLPEEPGLEGFSIVLEDAGGRYGMSGGQMSQDAFGNPLGTTYNPDGSVAVLGDGTIKTDANGTAVIKYLPPGKYGVLAIPPVGQGWQQTTTIEGTKVIDAWGKANEPPFFTEFGPAGVHVFFGFVKPFIDSTVLSGGPNAASISGQVVNLHLSAPPDNAFYSGAPFAHTNCWVGLNDLAVGIGRGVYAQPCDVDGNFSILNIPPGNYQLAIWDDNLDQIIAFHGVTVNPDGSCSTPNGSCNLGDVPVFQWFTRLENWVFYDDNENGFRDDGEAGILEQAINLRWRDGTVYQSFPTDLEGFIPFDETFPFFAWMVAEVDFARFKATGVTVTVDAGGPIDSTDPWTWDGQLNPQPQSENGGLPYRTETGPVLTQAFQGFIGQTSVLEWGKKAYAPGENGGITGIVYYATTRAEEDPGYAAAEPWEPGIPRVTVNLYDSTGTTLLDSTTTDSWDDNIPTGCQGAPFIFRGVPTDCYDGLRNWNQIRPGVFDGGYAFNNIPAGEYIVEVIPPPGYKIVKEEDKNVDFGDDYIPGPLLLPPDCVNWTDENGDGNPGHLVPAELALFPGVPSYYAGQYRPLCDRKRVYLSDGQNAAADFFLFTEVPISSHIRGFILDNAANEFDPNSPNFGEKYAPPWMPVSVRDWTGREVGRTYSDEYGLFNVLVPSTYSMNLPMPSGASPNMLTTCMNDPLLPNGEPDIYHNPQYSTFCYTFQYMPGTTTYLDTPVIPVAAFAGPDQFPLDCEPETGVPKVHSVSVPGNGVGGGPYVPAVVTIGPGRRNVNQVTDQPYAIVIESMGIVEVPNPEFDGVGGVNPKTVPRDFGFGTLQGSVMLGETALPITSWASDVVIAEVPAGTQAGSYQLTITRADSGKSTIAGSVVAVGLKTDDEGVIIQSVVTVDDDRGENPSATYVSIQDAIDSAGLRDLILVAPGTYNELVAMWKPVRLQGWGTGSTMINAVKAPAEKLAAWRQKVGNLISLGAVDLLPAQEAGVGVLEPATLFTEEGAGIIVLAKASGEASFNRNENRGARIDGFSIFNADTGGGIVVNGYADFLEIGNTTVKNNSGFFGGGIRVGHPQLVLDTGQGLEYQDADNDNISIHHSYITENGGQNGAGGGISLNTGSDNYQVTNSYICGNLTLGEGAGVGHLGLSDNGLIANNTIIFNESFNQGATVSGGGIFISGQAPLGGPGTLTPGSGSVDVIENLIQGNAAGGGDGGGFRISRSNGQDADQNRNNYRRWYTINILDNMIVNNVAALAGAGISLQDSVKVNIIHNTIANNDSTATASEAFTPGNPNQSNPQPAGIVSRGHSNDLNAVISATGNQVPAELKAAFSNPRLVDNIIWHNRSFYFFGDPFADPPLYVLLPDIGAGDPPVYDDLAVIGTAVASQLSPTYGILTDTTGYDGSNIQADPLFMLGYENGGRGTTVIPGEPTTALQVPVAFDEGGTAIRVRFGPLTLGASDYHIQTGSPAVDAGLDLTLDIPELSDDFDGDPRPNGSGVDMGADEL